MKKPLIEIRFAWLPSYEKIMNILNKILIEEEMNLFLKSKVRHTSTQKAFSNSKSNRNNKPVLKVCAEKNEEI
jgi:hypothetical protein